ncbi:CPXCG motif-containing cysteine-rich protein [Candidatus Thioglobus autotrophicus]|uniref:CPXCG motif-containing cysteine-rich protein n=1 Tax=Candidatus Thioglobus autotrophicus TaxID=1705394 RepID=UPI00299EA7E1|nr:CPXCG motif-containing cysteine-rich protein [Candidatus Thioglobus autotrophicus]WPE18178.1 CPXCG motif-containing cysteine-rich protein [Candidatus Thioglobus autotrophicus]
MNELQQHSIMCPYCGEFIDLDIDCSEIEQSYIEDCSVCCRPINIHVSIDFSQQIYVLATHENE